MNVRRTSLIIVLALALAACAAPIQAPPIRPQQPSTQQEALPFLNETKQGQAPAVTAPDVFVPEIKAPTSKAELPSMEDMAWAYPWVALPEQQKRPTNSVEAMAEVVPPEVRADIERYAVLRLPTLEELTLGVPQQIHDQIKQYVDDLNMPITPMYERDRSWLEEAPALPATPMYERDRWWLEEQTPAPAQSLDLEQLTLGVPQQIHEDIAQFVGAREFVEEVNQATLPAAIQRDQWWLDETAPPASIATDLSLDALTAGVPPQIYADIAQALALMHAPEIEQLTRGVPQQIQPSIVQYVISE